MPSLCQGWSVRQQRLQNIGYRRRQLERQKSWRLVGQVHIKPKDRPFELLACIVELHVREQFRNYKDRQSSTSYMRPGPLYPICYGDTNGWGWTINLQKPLNCNLHDRLPDLVRALRTSYSGAARTKTSVTRTFGSKPQYAKGYNINERMIVTIPSAIYSAPVATARLALPGTTTRTCVSGAMATPTAEG